MNKDQNSIESNQEGKDKTKSSFQNETQEDRDRRYDEQRERDRIWKEGVRAREDQWKKEVRERERKREEEDRK